MTGIVVEFCSVRAVELRSVGNESDAQDANEVIVITELIKQSVC